MSLKCNHCVNKSACSECHEQWKDKFIPSDEVKEYFRHSYCWIPGHKGWTYDFDTTNENLVPTHSILIDNTYYCPYCGEKMYLIQDGYSLAIIDHCCICQGARDEIEFEKEKKALEEEHRKQICELQDKYKDKLTFCSDKLFEIKQQKERQNFEYSKRHFKPSHISTLNGKPFDKIEDIIR